MMQMSVVEMANDLSVAISSMSKVKALAFLLRSLAPAMRQSDTDAKTVPRK